MDGPQGKGHVSQPAQPQQGVHVHQGANQAPLGGLKRRTCIVGEQVPKSRCGPGLALLGADFHARSKGAALTGTTTSASLTSQTQSHNRAAEHHVKDGKSKRAPDDRLSQASVCAAAPWAVVHSRQHGRIRDAEGRRGNEDSKRHQREHVVGEMPPEAGRVEELSGRVLGTPSAAARALQRRAAGTALTHSMQTAQAHY